MEYGAIFGAIVGFATVEHAVQRSDYVWTSGSVVTTTAAGCVASLIVLGESLIKCSLISLLRRCSKIILPILWWPTSIRINIVHWLGVAALAIIVARS
jgi:hypothetical protein